MKRWVIYYLIISLLFGAIIYLITLFQVSQEQTNAAFIELTNNLYETKDIHDFTRYSTRGYEKILREETSTYVIEVIQALGSNEGMDLHQLVIFIIPIDHTTIPHAIDVNDTNDQSQLILVSDTLNFNSKEDSALKAYALSVGIETLGFYYYALTIEEDISGMLYLYDYEGQSILESQLNVTHLFEETTFIPGMTESEIEAFINIDAFLNEILITRLMIFAGMDVALAIVISIILRRKDL